MMSPTTGVPSTSIDIGEIYGRWTLDCLVESATAVATDYVKRYRQYRGVPAEIATILADMRSRIGSDPAWPNTAQRAAINSPLLGPSDLQASTATPTPFRDAAMGVRTAAISYSERVYDTGEPMLRQAFVDAARHFQAYLTTLTGSVVERAKQDTQPIFEQSTQILSNSGVSQAFGLPPAPKNSWPLPQPLQDQRSYLDGDGAYLMEEISRVLQPTGGPLTQQRFLTSQRAAAAGGRTIQLVVQGDQEATGDKLRGLIGYAYTWATALRDLRTNGTAGK